MIKLNVNLGIYSIETINEVVKAYSKLAKIKVTFKKDIAKLTFVNCKYDEKRTVKEFENYLIGIENL